MKYRKFGKTSWSVSEVGYGMWGMAGWTGSDDQQSEDSLDLAVELGCNFFDTAWAYGEGKSETLLGELLRRHPDQKLYVATKVPPKNRIWPSQRSFALDEVFPSDYIMEYAEKSLKNLGVETIDLLQFHVWEDHWAEREGWKRAAEELKTSGKGQALGISINRWEPNNSLETLRTGLIDGVQVIYNIFDQAPEDQLFPLCEKLGIGVIARVPFDEGTLTGNLNKDTTFPESDWRSTYFVPENLKSSVEHAEAVQAVIPNNMSLPEVALKFILHHPAVSTVIPGMRKATHVRANLACSESAQLPESLLSELKNHRWDREPTEWSQ
jgi:aryl-alcohol dehydrogenase-like predicted oxidoreductase